MKIIFFGSDDFALVNLEKMIHSEHQVVACVTQPDKPKGRGMAMSVSVIKECAQRYHVAVLQPERLKDPVFIEKLKSYQSDLFVVVAYGKILPLEVISLPYVCCMNVHGSLLPKYRGAAPINWAIINGEEDTGVTIIKMNARMDAGDIFAQAKIKIDAQETAGQLRSRMAVVGADLLLKTINSLENNAYTLAVQDSSKVTLAPKLTKELGLICWTKEARSIHNLIRGLNPRPGAYTHYQGKILKILSSEIVTIDLKQEIPGEVLDIREEGFVVATADQGILVHQVQLESAKVMDARSFTLGHALTIGFKF